MATNKKVLILAVAVIAVIAFVLALPRQRRHPADKILAVVNDYKMTVEDYNYEAKEVVRIGRMLGEVPATKEELLDALIIKELMLQEAQKMGLDRDKDFMKAIELYWEQTLLKNLLAKKSEDARRSVTVYDDEIFDLYDRMKNTIRASVFVFSSEKAARRNMKADIERLRQLQGKDESLLYSVPSRVYDLLREESPLVYAVFGADAKNDRAVSPVNDKWALVIVEERSEIAVPPLEEIRPDLEQRMKTRKEAAIMRDWVDTLRSNARIRINKDVLKDIY